MIAIKKLKELLTVLKAEGVTQFKCEGLELTLSPQTPIEVQTDLKPTIDAIKEGVNMPPELMADELMKQENILFWSGSSDDQQSIALTGEDRLAAP